MTPLFLHGFGPRYDLPLSLSIYLFAAGGVVVVSFVMAALFAGDRIGEQAVRYPQRELRFLRGLSRNRWLRTLAGVFGVAYLLTVIATGWFGPSRAERNPAEYLVWVLFWAGLVILNGLVGPIWDAVNPFAALDAWLRRLRRLPVELNGDPDRLARPGLWPATVLFFAFACLELTSGYANRPFVVATLAAGYTVLTMAGMQLYGRAAWLAHVEFFTVLFSILRRFAPLKFVEGRVYLRPWGAGLLEPWPAGWDRVVFVVLMLSTLAFDGLLATPLWQDIAVALSGYWQPFGQIGFFALRTLGMIDLTLVFVAVFVTVMRLVLYFGSRRVDMAATISAFALTLVPIAFVYNAAHNYSFLVLQSQTLLGLLVAGYQVNFALTNAALVWYLQVGLIVLGHVVAVYLAHLRAGERFKNARSVLISQYPMLLLMVLYTMSSLWILAQPSTRGG